MVVPKRARKGKVEGLMDGLVTATEIKSTLFTGAVTGKATEAVLAEGVEWGDDDGILIADLTAAFGDPATLADGALFVFKNTADSKVYLVAVSGDAFFLEELTAAAAA